MLNKCMCIYVCVNVRACVCIEIEQSPRTAAAVAVSLLRARARWRGVPLVLLPQIKSQLKTSACAFNCLFDSLIYNR